MIKIQPECVEWDVKLLKKIRASLSHSPTAHGNAMKFDGDGMTDADNPETQRIMFFSASQRVETLPRHQARGSSNIEKHVTPMDPAVASKRKYDWGMMDYEVSCTFSDNFVWIHIRLAMNGTQHPKRDATQADASNPGQSGCQL